MGGDVNALKDGEQTPAMLAALRGQCLRMRTFLHVHICCNALCVLAGHTRCLQALLDSGADGSFPDFQGRTLAHFAALGGTHPPTSPPAEGPSVTEGVPRVTTGQLRTMELLREYDQALDEPDVDGITPAGLAAHYGMHAPYLPSSKSLQPLPSARVEPGVGCAGRWRRC